MPEVDKTRITRMLFPAKRKRRFTPDPLWYQKKRQTLNAKLRQAIIDVMPFDTDKKQADVILDAIFNVITDGIIRGERVQIQNLGFFWLHKVNACWRYDGINKRKYWQKPGWKVMFTPCLGLRHAGDIKETDGDSGTD